MNIGEVSRVSGLPIKTIRYYEDMGLIRPLRQANGYRVFDQTSLERLCFLRRARKLGFSVKDCLKLLELYEKPQANHEPATQIAQQRLSDVNKKIRQLQSVKMALSQLLGSSVRKHGQQTNILNDLAFAELVGGR